MPNKRNAIKELRKAEKRSVANLRKKRTIKSLAKDIVNAVEASNFAEAQKLFPAFQKAVDKAAKTGVLKKNTASRKKSRIQKRISKAQK
ncbi:MAG: 30S ribosomal protein S20 [Patescibacteria group bacterium]